MRINRYSLPATLQYTPVDFNTLFKAAAYQQDQINRAQENLNSNLEKWGEFQSPSKVDTQRYYDLTVGSDEIQSILNEAVQNPDAMKSAAFRSKVQSTINNRDYSLLSQLKESAENLKAGLSMRAKMEAEGRYNPNWDESDITNYDTLGLRKVFSDITPTRYMSAYELSEDYFKHLLPGDLGFTWKDGVRYRMIGNSLPDLELVYGTYKNDLLQTPQGRAYYNQFLKENNGDADAAERDFKDMIISSQMSRTVRPKLEVDTGYYKARQQQTLDNIQSMLLPPTRKQMMEFGVANKAFEQLGNLPEDTRKNVISDIYEVQAANQIYANAYEAWQKIKETGDEAASLEAFAIVDQAKRKVDDINLRITSAIYKDEFEKTSGFKAEANLQDNENYSKEGYLRGVNAALNRMGETESLIPITEGGDPILTMIGGNPAEQVRSDGHVAQVYNFESSDGFLLPESLFQLVTGTEPVENKREVSWFRDDSFAFREALESGAFSGVSFIPKNSNNLNQVGNNLYLSGKLRIPAEQIENLFGTGMWNYSNAIEEAYQKNWIMPFGRRSTKKTLEQLFGAVEVSYGEDNKKFYEVDVQKQLPNSARFWEDVIARKQNEIGGNTYSRELHANSIISILNSPLTN